MEICGHPKEVWNRSETVWNCRKAAISADPTFVWKFRSETAWNCRKGSISADPTFVWKFRSETVWNCRKAAISADPTFVWKFVDVPKRSETVWNCRKAAISADPTFVWRKFVGIPKRSETGLKPSETVGKQLYPLILHLYGNLWAFQRGLKQLWNRLKL